MGVEFFYCSVCNTRLSGTDFDNTRAFEIRGKFSCDKCIEQLIAPLSFKEQEQILLDIKEIREAPKVALRKASPSPQLPMPRPRTPSGLPKAGATASRQRPAVEKKRANPYSLVFLVGTLVLVSALAVLYYMAPERETFPKREPSGTTAKKPAAPVKPAPPKPVKPAPPKSPAEAALQAARLFAKENPKDYAGQIERYGKAVEATKGSLFEGQTKKELRLVREGLKRRIVTDLLALDEELKAARKGEEFQKAYDRLEAARGKHTDGSWRGAIDMRVRDLGQEVQKVFSPLCETALEAKKTGAKDTVQLILARVTKWGIPGFIKDLERALEPPKDAPNTAGTGTTPAKPPAIAPPVEAGALSKETKAYRRKWRAAMALASLRDYEEALKALDRAEKTATGDAREEAAEDAASFKRVDALRKAILKTLSGWPRGEAVQLVTIDKDGDSIQVDGPLVKADAEGVEVMVKGRPIFLELDDLTARSLATAYGTREGRTSEDDRRTAALLCLIEGDPKGARMVLNGPSERIPAKYWAYARKLEESLSPASETGRKALEARKLYFQAEREFSSVRTRGAAIGKYRRLLNEHAGTPLVRRKRDRITARREQSKEFVFLSDDLAGGGTFKQVEHEKTGPCWTSDSDSPPSRARENLVEFSFYALPDTEYKGWVFVGGCCQETFQFFIQTTDLTQVHPKTREVMKAEPGSSVTLPVRHSIAFLKTRHEIHGGPKRTERWDWVALPLPKYTEAGLKTVRLLTEQKGFSVAWAAVSALRKSPPGRDSEMKKLVRERTAIEPVAATGPETAPAVRDPSLVGLWTLDGLGSTAADGSGNDNTGILVQEPARTEGKLGGGLSLDGQEQHVSIPNSPSLEDVQEAGYTVAAWFKPGKRPAEDGAFAVLAKGERGEGLSYTADGKFAMGHWLTGDVSAAASSRATHTPGRFYHLAGVVNRKEGTTRLYVNGRLEASEKWKANTRTRDFGTEIWRIGLSGAGLWPAEGVVDDVRIYSRALGANDVRILSSMGAGRIPTLAFLKPSHGQSFVANTDIMLDLDVTDEDGRLSRVEFYRGSKLIETDKKRPYFTNWRKVPAGMYTIRAKAIDRSGAIYWVGPVNIVVGSVKLYRAINLGGDSITFDGVSWEKGDDAPNVSSNGESLAGKDLMLDPETDGVVGQLLRPAVWNPKGTAVSVDNVPTGTYQVYLYVRGEGDAETFDISMNGKTVTRTTSGPTGAWDKLGPWDASVKDGSIHLTARNGRANFCGVEIWQVTR